MVKAYKHHNIGQVLEAMLCRQGQMTTCYKIFVDFVKPAIWRKWRSDKTLVITHRSYLQICIDGMGRQNLMINVNSVRFSKLGHPYSTSDY